MMIVHTEFTAGTNTGEAAADAVRFCRQNRCGVTFMFNGVRVTVFPNHTPNEVENGILLAMEKNEAYSIGMQHFGDRSNG